MLEQYGKQTLFLKAVGMIKRKDGYIQIEERIALRKQDRHAEEE